MATYFTLLTKTGQALLATANATGTPVQLTHMAVGDGNGAAIAPQESQTTLIHEVWRGALNALSEDPNNAGWLLAEVVIPESVGGFTIREVGLFDKNGLLVAVGSLPASYKPQFAEGSAKTFYIRMRMEIGNASSVTLLIDPSVVLATRSWVNIEIGKVRTDLEDHVADRANPHQTTAVQVGAEPSGAVAAHNADDEAHPDIRAAIAGIVIPEASETVAGISELATVAEAVAGTGEKLAVTPPGLAAALEAAIETVPDAPAGYISGLALVRASANTVSVAAGQATDGAGALVSLGAAVTKSLGSAWGAGSGAGGLDAGSVAAGSYYGVWLIATAAGAADVIFSAAASPALPAGYTRARLIGRIRTDASAAVDALAVLSANPAIGGREIITASRSFVVPAWAPDLDVQVQGGGSGGGAGNQRVGSSGGYARKRLRLEAGASLSCTIGAGGSGTATTGGPGGTTSFSTYVTCTGGDGAGNGGTASGGDVNIVGEGGVLAATANNLAMGGADSLLGLGGRGANIGENNGGAGTGYGSGGGSAGNQLGSAKGGDGAPGVIIINV
jgi:hypothetical protein